MNNAEISNIDKRLHALTLLHLAVSDQRSPAGRLLAMTMLQDLCAAFCSTGIEISVVCAVHIQDPFDPSTTLCGNIDNVNTLFCTNCLSNLADNWGIGLMYKSALTTKKEGM